MTGADTRSHAIETARKLLRLRDRAGTPAEAQAAAHALARLLDRHRIAVAELEAGGSQPAEPFVADKGRPLYEYRRVTVWRRDLGLVLCEHFGVACWVRARQRPGHARECAMHLCGRPSDIELVRGLYTWLGAEIVRLGECYCSRRGVRFRSSWQRGFVAGVEQQLRSAREQAKAESSFAMVLYSRGEDARRYMESLLELQKTCWRSRADTHQLAYLDGLEQGSAIHLGERIAEPDRKELPWSAS